MKTVIYIVFSINQTSLQTYLLNPFITTNLFAKSIYEGVLNLVGCIQVPHNSFTCIYVYIYWNNLNRVVFTILMYRGHLLTCLDLS